MKLFEIRNGAYGNSCVRCYAWAENEQNATELFYEKNPHEFIEEIELLFDAEEVGEFITRLDDNGWWA
jgi:MoaA/NifB/PqqE/SkfB family radical SAM enzyme